MNDCVYAIPGLMPPNAPNWNSVLKTPEDGSLLMCVHVGSSTDVVTWSIQLPGYRPGVIKDPDYAYTGRDCTPAETPEFSTVIPDKHSEWQQFLKTTDALHEDCLMPVAVCNGVPRPIDELYNGEDAPTYWYLELPIRSLPIGDSIVEVCINNVVRSYIIQRPKFNIHKKSALSEAYINAGK